MEKTRCVDSTRQRTGHSEGTWTYNRQALRVAFSLYFFIGSHCNKIPSSYYISCSFLLPNIPFYAPAQLVSSEEQMHRARLASTGHSGQPQSQLAPNDSTFASAPLPETIQIVRHAKAVLLHSYISSHSARQHHCLTLDKVCFTSNSYYNLATNITSFHLMCASWIIPQIALLQIPRGLLGLGGAQLWCTFSSHLKIAVDAVPKYTDTPSASFRRSSQLSAWTYRPVAYGLARERTKPSRGAFSSPSLSPRLSCALTYPFAVLVPSQYPPCQAFRTTPLPSLQICHCR